MKFRIRFRNAFTGKQVKQKTITADDWDEAELTADRLWDEIESTMGIPTDMAITRLTERGR